MSRFRVQDKTSGKFLSDDADVTQALKRIEVMIGDKAISTQNVSQADIETAIKNVEQLDQLMKDNKAGLEDLRRQLDKADPSQRKQLENEEGVMLFTLIKNNPEMYKKYLPTLLAVYTKFKFNRLAQALANDQIGYDAPRRD